MSAAATLSHAVPPWRGCCRSLLVLRSC
jgi:hypothetical protein